MSIRKTCSCTIVELTNKDFYRVTKELKFENKMLRSEVQEIRMELNQCLEKMRGFEEESRLSGISVISDNDSANTKAIDALKLQLCTACHDIFELKAMNRQLEQNLMSLNCQCARMEDYLRNQEIKRSCNSRRLSKRRIEYETHVFSGYETPGGSYTKEVDALKLQLLTAWNDISELNFENRRLKEELDSLKCKCLSLENDLIKQEVNEEITQVGRGVQKNNGKVETNSSCKHAKQKIDSMEQKESEQYDINKPGISQVLCEGNDRSLQTLRGSSNMNKMDHLKRELGAACRTILELNSMSRRLEEDLASLNCKCAWLEQDLKKSKRGDEETRRTRTNHEVTQDGCNTINVDDFNTQREVIQGYHCRDREYTERSTQKDSSKMKEINERLEKELAFLNDKCAELEEELKQQKAEHEEETTRQQTLTEPERECEKSNGTSASGEFRCDSDLDVIARKLSKTLKESEPCKECATMPKELTGATRQIKDLTDMVQHRKKGDIGGRNKNKFAKTSARSL